MPLLFVREDGPSKSARLTVSMFGNLGPLLGRLSKIFAYSNTPRLAASIIFYFYQILFLKTPPEQTYFQFEMTNHFIKFIKLITWR